MHIGPQTSSLPYDPEKSSIVKLTVTSLGGSPTALDNNLLGRPGEAGAYLTNDEFGVNIQLQKLGGDWQAGDTLKYSISFSDASLYNLTSWAPSGAIVSAGCDVYDNNPEASYQVGYFAPVPDTGSTAALLGVGVAALAFARRKLG